MPGIASRPQVAIVQRVVPHYRVEFFNRLAETLTVAGVDLRVIAGQPVADEGFGDSRASVSCIRPVRNRYLPLGAYLQPLTAHLRGVDLVILEHANAPLMNHLLVCRRASGARPRLAFWGHGGNLNRASVAPATAWLKRRSAQAVDHWFAYTELTQSILTGYGIKDADITVVNNSQATNGAISSRTLPAAERLAVRATVGLGSGPCAVFCGRLYPGKSLEFLVDAVRTTRASVPDLQLLVIGDGELRGWLNEAATTQPWLVPVGARYGAEKYRLLAAADFMVMPSWVGLSVLDAFASGLPVATVAGNRHSPEIAYLEDGRNARITGPSVTDYAAALVELASQPDLAAALSAGALKSARVFSLDAMCSRFSEGIRKVLAGPLAVGAGSSHAGSALV